MSTSTGLLCLSVAACSSPPERATSDPTTSHTATGDTIISDRPPARSSSSVDATVAAPTPAEVAAAAQYRQLGLELRSQGQLDEAIAAFQQGVTLDPTNLDGQVILGWTLHLAGQRDAAIESLQAALTVDETFVPALNALGIVYLVSGHLSDAKLTHLQAVELQPDNEIAQYNLSLTYQRLEEFDSAVAHAIRATELEPDNPHPWVALAIALRSRQESEQASRAYARAVQLDARYGNSAYLSHLAQAGFSPEQIQLSDRVRMGQ
ncbi:MAG: tetratricopeptide repeat protein [Cyanobacteria bacterium P01_E01_bin.34]